MNDDKTAFCVECGKKKAYTVISRREKITIRGTEFTYVEQTAYCADCKEEVYVPEINDQNVQAREDAYRENAGLITIQGINEILNKYDIGAGPLAKLMGFGEVTINRYINGQLPSRANSDALMNLKKSYRKMEEYLQKNGNKISENAYKKCRAAVDKLKRIYGNGKIDIVARYLLHKDPDITPMALQKMLYYAQAFYKAIFDTSIFNDRCEAWAHGPVYRDVYFKYRDFGYDPIKLSDIDFDMQESGLTAKEVSFLDAIIAAFGCYSASVLRNMTHNEQPWIEARGSLRPTDRCSNEIDSNSIDRYFKKVVEKYNMINPCDIAKYSRSMAEKIWYSRFN